MAKKRKLEEEPLKEVVLEKVELISYKTFFIQALHQGLVKPWQEREIEVFFKDLGLSGKESSDKYLDMLKKY